MQHWREVLDLPIFDVVYEELVANLEGKSREMIDLLVERGREQPDWALCGNPACPDCVRQRAALHRARFEREAFRVGASARLAGRYVPEMIENLQAAGIDAVELDVIQGQPAFRLDADRLRQVQAELAGAEIRVAALRAPAATENDEAILDLARAAGIRRVVLPLSVNAKRNAEQAQGRGLELSFFNQAMSSQLVSQLLLDMKEAGLSPGFTFSAANFARIGEKPFGKSWKQKLRRSVDQLDVEDAAWSGEARPLAGGNAEIKEMISILRCASFAGWFILGAGAAPVENLCAATRRFIALLDRM